MVRAIPQGLTARTCWIPSESGKRINLLRPSPDDIRLGDIATGLSLECRYGNQLKTHYSVAQHSVLVTQMMEVDGYPTPAQALGCLHDAPEAYLGDVVGPLKRLPGMAFYRELEEAWITAILFKYSLYGELRDSLEVVKKYDLWALRLEAESLFGDVSDWECLRGVVVPGHHQFEHPVGHEWARMRFLAECERLGIKD